jgi:hypothetical protein
MKKMLLCACLTAALNFYCFQVSQADELSDLKEQMEAILRHNEVMTKQMDQQAAQIEAMRARMEILEAKEARIPAPSKTSPDIARKVEQLQEEVQFLNEQQNQTTTNLNERINMNIYTTLEFASFKGTHSAFDARNVELLAEAKMTDRLKTFMEVEFERTAKTSGDTDNRQGEVEVEQGWVEYSISEYIKPRFGVILVPFGRLNLEHFDPTHDLTDRPLLARRVVPTTWAEAGAGFTGSTFLGRDMEGWFKDVNLDYQFFVVNGLTNEFTDTGPRDARGAYGSDNNNNKAVVGRLQLTPFAGQEFGISGYYGKYDTGGHAVNGLDLDGKLTRGPFEFIGEYAAFALEEGGFELDGTTTVPGHLNGYFVEARYHFWFDSLNNTFLGRGFADPKFTWAVRHEEAAIDDDGDANTDPNKEYRQTIGFNYRPSETFVYKFEYQFNHTTNEPLEHGNRDGFIGSVTAAF